MPDIQVFGTDESPATRGAIRFFRERRVVVSFVDLGKRPMAPTELVRHGNDVTAGKAEATWRAWLRPVGGATTR